MRTLNHSDVRGRSNSSISDSSDRSKVNVMLDLMGYSALYPPQELALSKGITDGKNLLIATPTASGKTLTAMIAAIGVLERGLKVAYLTPLRALAAEKFHDFKLLEKYPLNGRQIKVRIASGDYSSPGKGLSDADIIVATNEKMDSLIRQRIGWLQSVGLFISDEFHLLSDRERGPTLEMLLTKIRKNWSGAQILALSATVANAGELADWLGCELVESTWRPTKLVEGIFEEGLTILNDGSQFTVATSSKATAPIDVAIDCIAKGGQSLIFAETRKRCVSLATRASEAVHRILPKEEMALAADIASKLIKKGDDTELTMTLAKVISKGVAFHHAGLTHVSREVVETAYKNGVIKLIVATPTLASGVNLPARRVILSSVMRYDLEQGGNVPIGILEYKQLCGRAGRPKYDERGEGIIIAADSISGGDLYDHYVNGTPEPIRSNLMNEKAIRSHVLSAIAEVPGIKRSEIDDLFANTLCANHYGKSTLLDNVQKALYLLEEQELVKSKHDRFITSPFGRTVSLLYLDPLTGVRFKKLIEKIKRNDKSFRNDHTLGYLHVITDCDDFYPKIQLRRKDQEYTFEILTRYENQLISPLTENDCTRTLLVLNDWIQEASVKKINLEFAVEPGDLYRIVEAGERLASSLYEIVKLFEREDLLMEVNTLRKRIRYGAKTELLPLLQLTGIGRARARALFEAGIIAPNNLARIDERDLAKVPNIGRTLARRIKRESFKYT